MEGQFISFYKNEVTLEVFLDDETLSSKGESYASLIVDTGMTGCKVKYWDNLSFFLEASRKDIKKECKPDIVELGLNWREVYGDVKYLIKKAKKLGYL